MRSFLDLQKPAIGGFPFVSRLGSTSDSAPSIFVAHPSSLLTDHLPYGDGIVAHGFLSRLAERGYRLHVAVEKASLQCALPGNVTMYDVKLRSNRRATRHLEYAVRVRSLFHQLRKKHQFVLSIQMNPVSPGISLALLGTRIPIVLGTYVARWSDPENRFNDAYNGSRGILAWLRDVVVSLQQAHADALLVTTPAAMNRIPWLSAKSRKIYTLPHGIDTELFFPPGEESERHRGLKRILFFGGITKRKGILDLLHAFPVVLKQIPDATLTIIGQGDAVEAVREEISRMDCSERITFNGPVNRIDAASVYRSHTVYCLPSYGEPYATSLLEAMACGLPIVTTAAGGTPFLVNPKGTRLVAPGDVHSLAKCLVEVLSSEESQRTMGTANRQTAVERFAWDKVIDQLEQIYFIASRGRIGRRSPHFESEATKGERMPVSQEVLSELTQ
jgi:glycosyltransferase involved in cell wall biosynthesis